MSDNIKIIIEEKGQPNLRKLARALISLATRLQEDSSDGSSRTSGGDSSPEVAA